MRGYEKYKDSGVEWVNEIPNHWKVKKVKHVLQSLNHRRIPLSSSERGAMKNKKYDYYGASGVIDQVDEYLFDDTLILVGEDGANLLTRSTRLAFIASGKFWVNNHAHILKPKKGNVYYFSELLETYDFTTWVTGSAQPKLTQENLANIPILEPPLAEQTAIAHFLDHKTRQIDTAIEQHRQLIELSKEHRAALINEAVTKGLSAFAEASADEPAVEMKDSGVEWIGAVPGHWEVVKLKYLASVQTGTTPPSENRNYYHDGKLDWFTPSDFNEHIELMNSNRKITEFAVQDGKAKLYRPYSVLLVGIGATLGKVGITRNESSSNQQINAITFEKSINPFYGAYFLKSISPWLVSFSNSSTLAILNQGQTKDIEIPKPPQEEQVRIVEYIKNETTRVDAEINDIETEIQLLEEYRQSLIAEAVTGKIDVRDYVIPAGETVS